MSQKFSFSQISNVNSTNSYSNIQLLALVLLRMMIGWHLLYEGVSKLKDPHWTSAGYLAQTEGFLKGFSLWIRSNEQVLHNVDVVNQWGLVILGLSLILGLFSKMGAIMACILLLFYYFCSPNLGIAENLYINKLLIEAGALFVLFLFPTGHMVGLDLFFDYFKMKRNG